jgi:hypothetical protein
VATVGASPSAGEILKRLKGHADRPRLFVQVPPDRELAASLRLGVGSAYDGIEVVTRPSLAHYILVGRLVGGVREYAWVLPNETQEGLPPGVFPLPIRTDWVPETARLEEQAVRLRRLRSWLQLEAPSESALFTYRLALKNAETGETRTDGVLENGQGYGLVLRSSAADLEKGVERRYVYVFVLDSYGSGTLLFPRASAGNVENRVPYEVSGNVGFPQEIPLGPKRLFEVGPPFGVDTYVMLSTVQPIPDPSVLQFSGVRTRGNSSPSASPLGRLLEGIGSPTRGVTAEAPVDWSIQRLSLRSVGGGS